MSLLLGATAVWLPVHWNGTATQEALSLGATLVVTLFLEIAGRRTAWIAPEKLGIALVPFFVAVDHLIAPLVRPASALKHPLDGRSPKDREREVTEEDIRLLVDTGQGLEESEKEMIHSIFELSETLAREIMVPRVDVVGVEVRTPLDQVLDLCLEKGLSRLPVFEGTVDNVVGIVMSKDLLLRLREGRMATPLSEIARPPYFVPGSKRVDELLRDMQHKKVAMAIVVDEYGGTDGIITMEDLIEEIVGEISDEYDKEERKIEPREDGTVSVDAGMVIEDVNALLDTDLPTDEYETIGGYVYGLLGHIPRDGESSEVDGVRIRVEQVQRQRIKRVHVARLDGTRFNVHLPHAERGAATSGLASAPPPTRS